MITGNNELIKTFKNKIILLQKDLEISELFDIFFNNLTRLNKY